MNILIKDIQYLALDEGAQIKQGDIEIEGSTIKAIGRDLEAGFEPDRIIDGKDMLAIPGLINTHTHAAMTLTRGLGEDMKLMEWLQDRIWPFEEGLTDEDVYWGTLLALAEMLRSGITSFCDMYFFMDKVAQAVEETGMRGVLSRGLVGEGPNPNSGLAESIELIEEWHGAAEGRIKVMLAPHAPYTCDPEFLQQVMDLAGKYGVHIHIHLAETKEEVKQILTRYGKRPVEHVARIGLLDYPVLAAHCVHLIDDEIDILAEKRVRVAYNPHSNMKLASGVAPVVKMLDAGIKVGFGTDGAGSNNKLDLIEEMRTGVFLQKVFNDDPTVLKVEEALRMATCWGAEALGLNDTGMLVPGMKADLVLLNLNSIHFQPQHDLLANLVFSARADDVDTVIVDGKILLEKGEFKTLDLEKIINQVNRRSIRLREAMKKNKINR